mmetsp:Transcript_35229/g.64363  ORF Transcript_35229/g.64363 Transcript_35229/m.64363 type:complete len:415 (-) Transcript_35229:160-1404(-)
MLSCGGQFDRVKGLLLISMSSVGFVIQGAFVHMLRGSIHPTQEVAARGTVAWVLVLICLTKELGRPSAQWIGRTDSRGWLLMRAIFGSMATLCGYVALGGSGSLGDAQALIQTQPLFATLFAAVVLGERPSLLGGIALFSGFVGAVLIAKPSFLQLGHEDEMDSSTGMSWSHMSAIGCGMFGGFVFVILRKMKKEHHFAIMNWQMMGEALVGIALSQAFVGPPDFRSLHWWHWLVLLSYGICAFIAQLCQTLGARLQNVAAGSCIRTLDVLLSYTVQLVFFPDDAFDVLSLFGSGCIVCSVILLVLERVFWATPETGVEPVPTACEVDDVEECNEEAEEAEETAAGGDITAVRHLPGLLPSLVRQGTSAVKKGQSARAAAYESVPLDQASRAECDAALEAEIVGREQEEVELGA